MEHKGQKWPSVWGETTIFCLLLTVVLSWGDFMGVTHGALAFISQHVKLGPGFKDPMPLVFTLL